MNLELTKRIITSIVLILVTIASILVNKYIFVIFLSLILYQCYKEWININSKYFNKKKDQYFLIKTAGILYLIFVFFTTYSLRGESVIYLIFILSICAFSDIGGFFIGKLIGGKKLTKISPNKTISGSVGSFIFSTIPILFFNSENFMFLNFKISLNTIIFVLIVSLSCQIGDLVISYFKRLNKIKDTGNILPGHGGILDRIDGIILSIPVVYLLKFTGLF